MKSQEDIKVYTLQNISTQFRWIQSLMKPQTATFFFLLRIPIFTRYTSDHWTVFGEQKKSKWTRMSSTGILYLNKKRSSSFPSLPFLQHPMGSLCKIYANDSSQMYKWQKLNPSTPSKTAWKLYTARCTRFSSIRWHPEIKGKDFLTQLSTLRRLSESKSGQSIIWGVVLNSQKD